MVFLQRTLHETMPTNLDYLTLIRCEKIGCDLYVEGVYANIEISYIAPVDGSVLSSEQTIDGTRFALHALYAKDPTPESARFVISVEQSAPVVFSPLSFGVA